MIITGQRTRDLIIILCLIWINSANSEILSNLQIMQSLIGSGMAEAFKATALDSFEQLIVLAPEPRSGNEWLVEQQLTGLMASHPQLGLRYQDRLRQESGIHALIFEFKIIDVQVNYQSESEGRIKRSIQVVWFMKLYTASGVVLFLDTMTKSHADQITRTDVAKVENSNLTLTQGRLPDAGLFSKFIEPMVVSFVSGLIIYLFFIMRSN